MVRHRRARTVLAAAAVVLPARLRRFVLVRLLGHEIDPTATVGRSFIDVEHLSLGPGALIGSLNVIRGCQDVVLGAGAIISNLNFINAVGRHKPTFPGLQRHPALIMAPMAKVTTMHFLDCSDRIDLGERSSIGGCWSIVMTHSFDHRKARQSTAPISVGRRTIVAARTNLLPGAVVGERCIVAAASTVLGPLEGDSTLWGGTPARALKALDPDSAFFQRTENLLV